MAKNILKSLSILALAFVSNAHAQSFCASTSQPIGFTKVNVVAQPKSGELIYFDYASNVLDNKRKLYSVNPSTGLRTTLIDAELSGARAQFLESGLVKVHLSSKFVFLQVGSELYRISYASLGQTTATRVRPCVENNFLTGLAVNNTNNKLYYVTKVVTQLPLRYQFFESALDGFQTRLIFETTRQVELNRNDIAFDTARNSIVYNTVSGTQNVIVRTNIDNPLVSQEIYRTSTHFIDALTYNNNNDTINFSATPRSASTGAQSTVMQISSSTLQVQKVGIGAFGPFFSPDGLVVGFKTVVYDTFKAAAYFLSSPRYGNTAPVGGTIINSYATSNGVTNRTNSQNFFVFAPFTVVPYSQDTLFKSLSHTNRVDAFDVDGDGRVVSSDALQIINAVSRSGGNVINLTPKTQATNTHLDVNRDNKVTASDALAIINEITRRNRM